MTGSSTCHTLTLYSTLSTRAGRLRRKETSECWMYCSNQVYGVKPDLLVFTINYYISVLLLVFTTIFYIKVMLGDNIFFLRLWFVYTQEYVIFCNYLVLKTKQSH